MRDIESPARDVSSHLGIFQNWHLYLSPSGDLCSPNGDVSSSPWNVSILIFISHPLKGMFDPHAGALSYDSFAGSGVGFVFGVTILVIADCSSGAFHARVRTCLENVAFRQICTDASLRIVDFGCLACSLVLTGY